MKIKKIPTYLSILAAIILGLIIGILSLKFKFSNFILDWISPLGEIFINLLKLIAVPLVFLSLVKSIGGLKDIAKLAKIGIKTIAFYCVTTLFAILIGISFVTILKPGKVVTEEASSALLGQYQSDLDFSYQEKEDSSPLQTIIDIFPQNMVEAMSNNSNMLQIIALAILIGVAAIMVGEKKNLSFMNLVDSLDAIVLKLVDIVMGLAPIGVFALISTMVISSAGDSSILGALGLYAITVCLALLFIMFVFYPVIITLFTNIKAKRFIKAMIPVQLMGFSSSSSAATLPTTMKACTEDLKIPSEISSFTLPVGVTINMDGTSCYQAIGAIFIAQALGIDLSLTQILVIIATTTLSSIGTPGIPGGSIVISMMILSSVGIPAEGLALILGIDRPLDMLRTSANVTGDAAVSAMIAAKK